MSLDLPAPQMATESWSEKVFQELFARSPDGMLVADPEGLILWANSAAMSWLSLSGNDLDRLPPSLREGEGEIRLANDRIGEARSQTFTWQGQQALLVCIRDFTSRHARERELQRHASRLEAINVNLDHLAHVDPLTTAENRRGIDRQLRQELERARRDGAPLCALLVDLDDFKLVNEHWGHALADRVLVQVTRVFKSMLRPQDIVGRIGGDEFLIVMPDTREAEGIRVAERLRAAVASQPIMSGEHEIGTTISIGLCPVDPNRAGITDILLDARMALSRGKLSGKNRVSSGDRALDDGDARRDFMSLVDGGRAPDAVLLPIFQLEDERAVGYEILSRGPKGPFEMPIDMFRACQDEATVGKLDLLCLGGGLKLAERLGRSAGRIHMNVMPATLLNVAPAAILGLFPGQIEAGRFVIEVSEQHVIGDPARLVERLRPLREAGISLAIDDVGFGRSSLETLVLLEPEIVKIARRYVSGSSKDPALERSLERLSRVATALGAEVIAEGIETESDRKLLLKIGIHYGQGFLWGLPQRAGG